MTHRAESIIEAVRARLTGLTTTGANVFRGRRYPIPDAKLPALLIYLGPDEPLAEYSQELIDSRLTIYVEGRVKTSADQVDSVLNKIREEVTIALQADYTQGLAYVIDTEEGEAEEPEISNEGEKPAAGMRMHWHFHYRRSRTNPGA